MPSPTFQLLPTRLVAQIAGYLDTPDLRSFAITQQRTHDICVSILRGRQMKAQVEAPAPRPDAAEMQRKLSQHFAAYVSNTLPRQGLFQVPIGRPRAGPSGDDQARVTGLASSQASIASSPSTESGFDSNSGTDTEVTSADDDEWEFNVTPDMMRRLSKLPKHKTNSNLESLPTELKLEIFSYLDKIDACCLGLSHPHYYNVYRSVFGTKMPLNTRRQGPNSLERAWEVVGKQQCAQCGIYRCELHQHIKTWMPKDLEYCSFKGMFGTKATEGSAQNCYRGKPSKPRRCGRHPLRTTSHHQDDNVSMIPMSLTMTACA